MFEASEDGRACSFESLDSTIQFTTYSDARLAELYLDNGLPFAVLERVLKVIFDPEFKREDVTLKNGTEILHYVSECRMRNVLERAAAETPSPTQEVVARPNIVPPIVLDFVVDKLLGDRVPLGVAAAENDWKVAFANNVADFHNMSLVHRSWTVIAQRGLRDRVVVPVEHIKEFLCSPFCGSAIREMIIYWTFDGRYTFVTDSDIRLLDELLRRNPNVRSLSFNTSLVWPRYLSTEPSLEIDYCLEAIAQRLPSLENLWLKHFDFNPIPDSHDEDDLFIESPLLVLDNCNGVLALYAQLPKLLSLKFLSITGWEGWGELDWSVHPPSRLKAVELGRFTDMSEMSLTWLLSPREEYNLESLSISIHEYDHPQKRSMKILKDYMSNLKRLVVFVGSNERCDDWFRDLLNECKELADLALFAMRGYNLTGELILPPSLEHLSVHLVDGNVDVHFLATSTLSPSGKSVVDLVKRNLPRLPLLRKLRITASDMSYLHQTDFQFQRPHLDEIVHFVGEHAEPVQERFREQLLDTCRDHNVELGS